MYFPGDDYQHYALEPATNALARRMFDGGYRRVLYRSQPDYDWPQYFDEVCFLDATGHYMRCLVDGFMTMKPAWSISHGTLEELTKKAASGTDTVYVNCDWGTGIHKGAHLKLISQPKKYAERCRWLYEIANQYRGKVKFIVFGYYDFEVYYCIGMDGGARPFTKDDRNRTYPNGKYYYRPEKNHDPQFKHLFDGLNQIEGGVNSLLATPKFVKDFYEKPTLSVSPTVYKKADFWLGKMFRSTRQTFDAERSAANSKRPANSHRPLYNDCVRCDSCSLSYACTLYRPLGVCTVPGSEGSELVKKFQSDNVEEITKGISMLLGVQAEMTESVVETYRKQMSGDKVDVPVSYSDVRQHVNDLIKNGISVAKLKSPNVLKPPSLPAGDGKTIDGEVVDGDKEIEAAIDALTSADKANIIRSMVAAGYEADDINPATIFAFMKTQHQPQIAASQESSDDSGLPF